MQLMVQGLLADRFQLKIHRQTKELPVYELSVAKGGFKLKEVAAPEGPVAGAPPPPLPPPGRGGAPPTPPPGSALIGRGTLVATAAQFAALAQVLSDQLSRSVVDKTGIKGFYDFKLKWTPDVGQGPGVPEPLPPVDSSGPSIFTAIQEQFGLKLDSAKGPVEIFVIDHVEKPTEN
jgi:uncharacterized protein (TIGR03435 family)